MIRKVQYLFFAIPLFSCTNFQKEHSVQSAELNKKSFEGLYSYSNKMEFPHICEIAVHKLKLNTDNSFNLILYCEGDTASKLKKVSATGKWKLQNDSTIMCSSKDFVLKLKVISEDLLAVIPKANIDPMLTYQRVTH